MTQNMYVGTDGATRTLVLNKTYPDGMPLLAFDGPLPLRFLLRPAGIHELVAGLFWVDSLLARGYNAPDLVLPFVPGARQDRLSANGGDFLFTLKSIATMINSRGFPSVTVLDPHSEVTPALIDRCKVVHAADCINPPRGKYAAVISPDAGAEKRAGAVARKLGLPLLHAWKTRDVSTGLITGFGMEGREVAHGSLVLVVDDICDGGGTFIGLADVLDAVGLKAHLWVTHGIFSNGTAPLLARFGHVYCTDSVVGARDGIIEISTCKNLLGGT